MLFVVAILFLFFWVSFLFNMFTNICRLEFPWIKVFDPKRSGRLNFSKILNVYQWGFIFVSFSCILWYIFLVVFWLVLASIIKSQAYMVSTITAIMLIFAVYRLDSEFKMIWWESKRRSLAIFNEMWNFRIQLIVKRMMKYMAEINGTVVEQIEGSIKTTQIISHEENLRIIKVNLEKIAEENNKTRNFINLFYSLVHRDPRLRNHLEILLQEAPFNFNRYMTQLLCNILFMSKCKPKLRSREI